MRGFLKTVGTYCLLAHTATAIDLTIDDADSIKSAASTVAWDLMTYYYGNQTGNVAGNLPSPYYWWEAGAMFGTLIDYWWTTGDETYNNETLAALVHQAGTDNDFMPTNQTRDEGNDDQGFWAMASMSAAETNFTNPPSSEPQWLALTQAVFNEYVERWYEADQYCGGGLRWQIFTFNSGYDYKNSISNGCFFNIASRLARYTGNATYAQWAEKIFEWELDVAFITPEWKIYDGASTVASTTSTGNCTDIDPIQWTYNAGVYLHGVSVMYNYTNGSSIWKERLDSILNETQTTFFKNGVAYEEECETEDQCDTDELSFKGYLIRWLAATTLMAPYTAETIMPLINSTAVAAAASCTGSPASGFAGMAGTACGFTWLTGTFDGTVGVGQQMNALSAVMYPLIGGVTAPVTANTGGSSTGNPAAGTSSGSASGDSALDSPITTASRVGAGFLTTAILGSLIGGCAFVVI